LICLLNIFQLAIDDRITVFVSFVRNGWTGLCQIDKVFFIAINNGGLVFRIWGVFEKTGVKVGVTYRKLVLGNDSGLFEIDLEMT
jgi:hypothetical protein